MFEGRHRQPSPKDRAWKRYWKAAKRETGNLLEAEVTRARIREERARLKQVKLPSPMEKQLSTILPWALHPRIDAAIFGEPARTDIPPVSFYNPDEAFETFGFVRSGLAFHKRAFEDATIRFLLSAPTPDIPAAMIARLPLNPNHALSQDGPLFDKYAFSDEQVIALHRMVSLGLGERGLLDAQLEYPLDIRMTFIAEHTDKEKPTWHYPRVAITAY